MLKMHKVRKILILLFILFVLFGCYTGRRVRTNSEEKATFTLINDWIEGEQDEVVLIEQGNIRFEVPFSKEKSASLSSGTTMKEFSLMFKKSGHSIEFLAGIRPGHKYRMGFSPCCLFQINDMLDDPYEFSGKPIFADSSEECPEGMITMYPGLANDPDDKHRCIPAPHIRFRIDTSVLNGGPVVGYIGRDIGNEEIVIDKKEETEYFAFDIVRSGSPEIVRLVQQGNLLWEGSVVFRVKHSYTLEYHDSEPGQLLIRLDD
jgi:hypothetical protein